MKGLHLVVMVINLLPCAISSKELVPYLDVPGMHPTMQHCQNQSALFISLNLFFLHSLHVNCHLVQLSREKMGGGIHFSLCDTCVADMYYI